LQGAWIRDEEEQRRRRCDRFGPALMRLRKEQGLTRRELADLFRIGGKKPARIIKHIEEDGFYSSQAFPAGLTAVLVKDEERQTRLLRLWQERRGHFHRRRLSEPHAQLRLARELYGFELGDMEPILGYSRLEYQRIERGVTPLGDSARARVLQAIHQAGRRRVEELLRRRQAQCDERTAWAAPPSVSAVVELLAQREGGLVPLTRRLRQAGVRGTWAVRLRRIARSAEVPPWPLIQQIAAACGVTDLSAARVDWEERYRARLRRCCASPLAVEIRLLIAETASTLRAFSRKVGLDCSVLLRDLQHMDRDEPGRWFHVERILRAVGLGADDERWREIHALWYTAAERRKGNHALPPRRLPVSRNGSSS
jgi:transcriptional regulator with XRE-family HTH domain